MAGVELLAVMLADDQDARAWNTPAARDKLRRFPLDVMQELADEAIDLAGMGPGADDQDEAKKND